MDPFWKSHLGKLLLAGWGTQVGLLFTCGTVTGALLLCLVCTFSNILAIGLGRELESWPSAVLAEGAPPEMQALLSQVEFLQGEMDLLRANSSAASAPADPYAGKSVVIASQGGVNLRGGPGLDYPKVGTLPLNGSLEIVGRNSNSSWWLVSTPDGFAWVSGDVVSTRNINDNIPVVTIPALLVRSPAPGSGAISAAQLLPEAGATPSSVLPAGTPIPEANASRQFVEDMPAYKRLRGHLLVPPVSASVSPDGSQIAITERIKLYTVTTEGALSQIWLEDNNLMGPLGNIVWSPDGRYLAFVVGYKTPKCRPCRSVGLLKLSDETITFLQAPDNLDTDMPRWTLDGRLLINVHPGEPADGVAYVYDTSGNGQLASGSYQLSSSNEGQKWFPWRPGKTWQVGSSQRADSYNSD